MIPWEKNFCRVFELPNNFPEGFLFGGGKPVTFKMIDWFNPIPEEGPDKWEDIVPMLKEFLKKKRYIVPGKKYIVITDFDEAFIFHG